MIRLFLSAKVISLLGDALLLLAFPLMVFKKTGLAQNIALTMSVELSLYAVTTLFSGALVDRSDCKKLCLWLDVGRGVLMLAVTQLFSHHFSFGLALAFSALMSVLSAIYSSAFDTLPHVIFEQDAHGKVVGYFQSLNQLALLSGSALAGAAISMLGTEMAFVIDGLTFFISAILLSRLQVPVQPHHVSLRAIFKRPKQILSDSLEGFKIVSANELIRQTLFLALALNIFSGAKETLWLPLLTKLGATPLEMGLSNSLLGLVFILATLGASRFIPVKREAWRIWLVLSQAAAVLACLLLATMASVNWIQMMLAGTLLHIGLALHSFVSTVLRRTEIPAEFAGRSLAAARVLSRVAAPLGMFGATGLMSVQEYNVIFQIMLFFLVTLSFLPVLNLLKKGYIHADSAESTG